MNQENTNWQNLHQKFVEYGRNAKEWMRKCVLLLPEIEKYEIWKRKGFDNIYEYARQLAGMSRDQVTDALWILKKIEDKPALIQVVSEKGLNSIRPIISIVDKENENFWAQKARTMSHHTLRTYVKERNRLECRDVTTLQSANPQNPKVSITLDLDPEVADQLNKLKGSGDWNTLMKELLELKKEKLETEKPAPATDTSGHIPKKIHDYVLKRSHGKCEFPNCTNDYAHLHHTNRLASNKIHDPDQIVALCEAHHDLAHKGLIDNEDNKINTWKILKEPDYTNLNWYIDQQVAAHRR